MFEFQAKVKFDEFGVVLPQPTSKKKLCIGQGVKTGWKFPWLSMKLV